MASPRTTSRLQASFIFNDAVLLDRNFCLYAAQSEFTNQIFCKWYLPFSHSDIGQARQRDVFISCSDERDRSVFRFLEILGFTHVFQETIQHKKGQLPSCTKPHSNLPSMRLLLHQVETLVWCDVFPVLHQPHRLWSAVFNLTFQTDSNSQ